MRHTFVLVGTLAALGFLNASLCADDAQKWGTIKGQIVWGGGAVPERKAINVNRDQQHCLGKGPLLSEDWVVNKNNKGVQWTFVWLDVDPMAQNKILPIHPDLQKIKEKKVTIDQPMCAFVPHCLAIREGQDLEVKNSSPIPHNVNWTGNPIKNPGGNILIPAGGMFTIDNLKADRFPLQIACNIHPWMRGRVAVFNHPYFAVTDANGNFEIKNAPAGNYRLKVYHETIGWRNGAAGKDGEKIAIKPGAVTEVGKLEVKPSE